MSDNENKPNNHTDHSKDVADSNKQLLIGTFLKNSRMSGKYSLKNLYQKTKINISLLEDLEENRLERLPHKAYVVGFVRNYAKVLNLDVHYSLDLLDKTYQHLGLESAPPPASMEEIAPNNKGVSNATIWTIIGICTLLALFIFLLPSENKKPLQTQDTPTENPSSANDNHSKSDAFILPAVTTTPTISPTPTPTPTLTPRPTIRPTVSPTPSPTNSPTATVVAVPTPIPAITGDENIANENIVRAELQEEAVLKPMEYPIYQVDETVSKEDLQAFLPESARGARSGNIQNLYIIAEDGESWITYKKDADPIKKYVLAKGKSVHLVGETIRLFMGNLNVCRIYLNGRLLKVDAPRGVKSLVFPQEKAHEFKRPLFLFKKDGLAITSDEWESGR